MTSCRNVIIRLCAVGVTLNVRCAFLYATLHLRTVSDVSVVVRVQLVHVLMGPDVRYSVPS
jgi:hypothetical protein